ncbi:heme ABC transporter permease CcmC [Paraburkholderia sacchari]|uniref:heme ABC transporter permease CcmC n=1 Tax=Paraburkholderia sacchari TaxID=159450 RepID=UPI001BCB07CE|nr:heme ABC transporter permease CcmC [Paraburkholderia sacchari]
MKRLNWFRYASPSAFDGLAKRLVPGFGITAVLLMGAGLVIGLAIAPADALQGNVYRIMFVHVPAAWMSMFIYLVMAAYCALDLVLNARLSAMMAQALAPTGALFTFIALVSGAFWGKPAWGTWWVWDARLTSELILLFLYAGFMTLHAAIDGTRRADRACAVLALIGVVNIPVIFFSVQWWYTLHQGPSLGFGSGVAMSASMVCGLLVMTAGFWCYAIAVVLARVRVIMRARERVSSWRIHIEERPA